MRVAILCAVLVSLCSAGIQWKYLDAAAVNATTGTNLFGYFPAQPGQPSTPGSRRSGATWSVTTAVPASETFLILFGGLGFGEPSVTNGTTRTIPTDSDYGEMADMHVWTKSTGRWTWLGGPKTVNSFGQPITVPWNDTWPSARRSALSWASQSTRTLFMFGGRGYAVGATSSSNVGDLWSCSNCWLPGGTWQFIGGSNLANAPGIIDGPLAYPGARRSSLTWTVGDVGYLFGGQGFPFSSAGACSECALSDLWRLDLVSGKWQFVDGPLTLNSLAQGVNLSSYVLGTESNDIWPGSRDDSMGWSSSDGEFLYMFGGYGYAPTPNPNLGDLSDLWRYNVAAGVWAMLSPGKSTPGPAWTPSVGQMLLGLSPGGRDDGEAFAAGSWGVIFGGSGPPPNGSYASFSDEWVWNDRLQTFAWLGGPNFESGYSAYTPGAARPGARDNMMTWGVGSDLYLFGGFGRATADTTLSTSRRVTVLSDMWTFSLVVCGDGLVLDEECDDGNLADNDGCSSQCTVETGWYCPLLNASGPSFCVLYVSEDPPELVRLFLDTTLVTTFTDLYLQQVVETAGREQYRYQLRWTGTGVAKTKEALYFNKGTGYEALVEVSAASGRSVRRQSASSARDEARALLAAIAGDPSFYQSFGVGSAALDASTSHPPLSDGGIAGVVVGASVAVFVVGCCLLTVIVLLAVYFVRLDQRLRKAQAEARKWQEMALLRDVSLDSLTPIKSSDIEVERKELGRGGFGSVHRGMYLGGLVAVKITNSDFVDFEEWQSECNLILRLRHPNIVQLYGVVTEPGCDRMIVMEMCPNSSLDKVYRNRPSEVTYVRLLRWMRQVCGAMSLCHSQGILHRDLKCGNLLLTSDWNVKVTDFGESQHLAANTEAEIHAHKGTLRWRAPELMTGVDGASLSAAGASSVSEKETTGGGEAAASLTGGSKDKSSSGKDKDKSATTGKSKSKSRREKTSSSGMTTTTDGHVRLVKAGAPLDVYAWALTVWELHARAVPFDEIDFDSQVERAVASGQRPALERVENMKSQLRDLMLESWVNNPSDRPSFSQLLTRLAGLTEVEFPDSPVFL